MAINPGATFRGLHDSLVNYGGNHAPEIILCTHEEIAVALAHGYARAKGKPMGAAVHNVVGLQHASMAIYNAWADRLPVIVLGGTGPMDTANRRPWIDWVHTALVQGNLRSRLRQMGRSAGECRSGAGFFYPGVSAGDDRSDGAGLHLLRRRCARKAIERRRPFPSLDRYPAPLPLQAPEEGFRQDYSMVLEAKRPVIIADWVGRKEAGFKALGELAEMLAAPVLDQFGRFNFPVQHPLNLTGQNDKVIPQADLILALDVPDLEGATAGSAGTGQSPRHAVASANAKIINVALDDLLVRAWATDFNKLREADLMILGRHFGILAGAGAPAERRRKNWANEETISPERRADWGKIYQEKRAALEKETKTKWDEKPIVDDAHLRGDGRGAQRRGLGANQRQLARQGESLYFQLLSSIRFWENTKAAVWVTACRLRSVLPWRSRARANSASTSSPTAACCSPSALFGPRCTTRFHS